MKPANTDCLTVLDMGLDYKSYQAFRDTNSGSALMGNQFFFPIADLAATFEPTYGLLMTVLHHSHPHHKDKWRDQYTKLQWKFLERHPECLPAKTAAECGAVSPLDDLFALLEQQATIAGPYPSHSGSGAGAGTHRRKQLSKEAKLAFCNLHLTDAKCNQGFMCNQLHLTAVQAARSPNTTAPSTTVTPPSGKPTPSHTTAAAFGHPSSLHLPLAMGDSAPSTPGSIPSSKTTPQRWDPTATSSEPQTSAKVSSVLQALQQMSPGKVVRTAPSNSPASNAHRSPEKPPEKFELCARATPFALPATNDSFGSARDKESPGFTVTAGDSATTGKTAAQGANRSGSSAPATIAAGPAVPLPASKQAAVFAAKAAEPVFGPTMLDFAPTTKRTPPAPLTTMVGAFPVHRMDFFSHLCEVLKDKGTDKDEIKHRVLDAMFFAKYGHRVTVQAPDGQHFLFFKSSYTPGRVFNALQTTSAAALLGKKSTGSNHSTQSSAGASLTTPPILGTPSSVVMAGGTGGWGTAVPAPTYAAAAAAAAPMPMYPGAMPTAMGGQPMMTPNGMVMFPTDSMPMQAVPMMPGANFPSVHAVPFQPFVFNSAMVPQPIPGMPGAHAAMPGAAAHFATSGPQSGEAARSSVQAHPVAGINQLHPVTILPGAQPHRPMHLTDPAKLYAELEAEAVAVADPVVSSPTTRKWNAAVAAFVQSNDAPTSTDARLAAMLTDEAYA